MKDLEESITKTAKNVFKRFGLSYWEDQAKIIVFLVVLLIPVCFVFVIVLLWTIFSALNYF